MNSTDSDAFKIDIDLFSDYEDYNTSIDFSKFADFEFNFNIQQTMRKIINIRTILKKIYSETYPFIIKQLEFRQINLDQVEDLIILKILEDTNANPNFLKKFLHFFKTMCFGTNFLPTMLGLPKIHHCKYYDEVYLKYNMILFENDFFFPEICFDYHPYISIFMCMESFCKIVKDADAVNF